MVCRKCGNKVDKENSFCHSCGKVFKKNNHIFIIIGIIILVIIVIILFYLNKKFFS